MRRSSIFQYVSRRSTTRDGHFHTICRNFDMVGVDDAWDFGFCRGSKLGATRLCHYPSRSNAVTPTWGFYNGGIDLSGSIPATTSGVYNVPLVSYYHSLSFFRRSADVTASLPYGFGTFAAVSLGKRKSAYRSGLYDVGMRLSVNLRGGPAMTCQEFGDWKQ